MATLEREQVESALLTKGFTEARLDDWLSALHDMGLP